MLKKYGPENLGAHYAEFDTICDATQVRLSTHHVPSVVADFNCATS